MPLEVISKNVDDYWKDIHSGNITIDQVLDTVYSACYGKPKVPESTFLKICRQGDPNFAPISSAEERQARAALTERVREGFREQIKHEFYAVSPEVMAEYQKQYGQHFPRLFFHFFRDCKTVEEQRELAQRLGHTGGEEMGKLFAERVLSKKDELLAMRRLSDAELVESYFKNKDLLDMVFEMQQYKDLGYTPEQQEAYKVLYNNMTALQGLTQRMI